MAEPRYLCRSCGTWACTQCGWKRPGASIFYQDHACRWCPSREGTLTSTLHTERIWKQHNDGDLPEPLNYNAIRSQEPRTASIGTDFYRGVRVPEIGPYARFDLGSWKRGVDDALGST